jgi:hypothetical protein
MSFTKITTIVQVSDNEDYDPNAGALNAPDFETTELFLMRQENLSVAGNTLGAGSLLGVSASATRVLVSNTGTQDAAIGYSSTTIMKLAAGQTSQWQVPSGTDPSTYKGYSLSNSVHATLLVMAWE